MKDFLGNKIEVGIRAIRVHSQGHYKYFKRGTIVEIKDRRYGDNIAFLTDGNSKPGWTYPERVITETAFNQEI